MATGLPAVVYIAGYGRSGSTILERVLGLTEGVAVTGELYKAFSIHNDVGSRCSCGQYVSACPFWTDVFDAPELDGKDWVSLDRREDARHRMEAVRWRRRPGPMHRATLVNEYRAAVRALVGAIITIRDESTRFLVDSSKSAYETATRARALHHDAGLDVFVIHLVRDARAVVWSEACRGSNLSHEGLVPRRSTALSLMTALVGWVFANRSARKLRTALGEDRYLLLHYEEFAERPDEVIARLSTFLHASPPLTPIGTERHVADGQHQLAGNRARMSPLVTVEPDREWEQKLPAPYRSAIQVFAGLSLRRYGYRV